MLYPARFAVPDAVPTTPTGVVEAAVAAAGWAVLYVAVEVAAVSEWTVASGLAEARPLCDPPSLPAEPPAVSVDECT